MNTNDQDGGDQPERDAAQRRDASIPPTAGAGRGLDTPRDYDDWKDAVKADPDYPRELQQRAGDMNRGYADDPEGEMPQKPSDFEKAEFAADPDLKNPDSNNPDPKNPDPKRGSAASGEGEDARS